MCSTIERWGLFGALNMKEAYMTIKSTAHYQAMKDLIEIMAIASVLGFVADCIWILRDMYADGITPGRFIVMALLDCALLLQSYAFIKFHSNLALTILNTIKIERRKICKLKAKHNIKQGGVK